VAEAAGLFEQIFEPYCTSDPAWNVGGGERWPIVRVRGDLALIGLSTSQPSAWFMGHGTVGPTQLDRLEQTLLDPRLADKLRVIVMHHPSAGRHARSLRRGLRDRDAFAAVLARAGAELVVHGHEHLDLRETLPGVDGRAIPVLGVQSGSYGIDSRRKRARYRVFTIGRRASAGPSARPEIVSAGLRTWRRGHGFVIEEET
jgi:3',5'-cyclic AMP phosphodiesterase CpdA